MLNLVDYKTEHLFLLIGENPLPNYVAAKLLATPNRTIHLIHSAKTVVYAQRLENKLKDKINFAEKICIKPSNSDDIRKKITSRIEVIQGTIGLNYTGGTKAMAVHVYRTIVGKQPNAKFSYLNPRNLEMIFDPPEGVDAEVVFSLNKPNGTHDEKLNFKNTKISLDELLYLHKLTKFSDKRNEPRGIRIIEALQSEAIEKDSWWKFQKDLRKVFNATQENTKYNAYDERNKSQMETQLRLKTVNFPNDLPYLAIAFGETFSNLINASQLVLAHLPNDVSAINFVNLLLGTWLEDFVLSKIKNVKDECFLEDYGSSLEIAIPDKNPSNPKRKFFELDVVAMRGYRLFAVSCTQESSVFKAKHKLFEAVHRAKQIGGDEARIGLVCLAKSLDINKIKSQLEEENIEVFGKEDLPKLDQELEKWFNQG